MDEEGEELKDEGLGVAEGLEVFIEAEVGESFDDLCEKGWGGCVGEACGFLEGLLVPEELLVDYL